MSDVHSPQVIFLHGLGEDDQVWQPVIDRLPDFRCRAVRLFDAQPLPEAEPSFGSDAQFDSEPRFGPAPHFDFEPQVDHWPPVDPHRPLDDKPRSNAQPSAPRGSAQWSLQQATERVAGLSTDASHFVGLSLGAVVALDLAARYPEKVRSLFCSAPQIKAPRALLRAQSAVMRILPARMVSSPGMSKQDVLSVLDELSDLDLTAEVKTIRARTTIACGSKDRANLAAAKLVADLIPDAELEIVPGLSHRWHASHPDLFAARLRTHLQPLR